MQKGCPAHFQPIEATPIPVADPADGGERNEARGGEQRETEEEGEDEEQCLMQNGVQLGDIAEAEVAGLADDLQTKLEKVKQRNPGKSKDLLLVVGAMVVRNSKSLLPAVRQVCHKLRAVLGTSTRDMLTIERVPEPHHRAWAKRYW